MKKSEKKEKLFLNTAFESINGCFYLLAYIYCFIINSISNPNFSLFFCGKIKFTPGISYQVTVCGTL